MFGAAREHEPSILAESDPGRLRAVMDEHFDFTWRCLRRLGLPPHAADDATQRVFLVVSRRLPSIRAGAERAFLFQTAVRVAQAERRTVARRREVFSDSDVEAVESAPRPDELLDQRRARVLLEQVLASLDLELRAVLVLFEFEGLSVSEIAQTLGIPRGTAASRLRRARDDFNGAIARWKAQTERGAR
jgi:RNA polymerase sigma-70 factor (ECF subfamily)